MRWREPASVTALSLSGVRILGVAHQFLHILGGQRFNQFFLCVGILALFLCVPAGSCGTAKARKKILEWPLGLLGSRFSTVVRPFLSVSVGN